ncbi:sodium/proton antiporter NapA, CPA2 family (TC 2.A.37.2.1) [Pilibacter termitis]|uniref:Sodium/proton antiporter NapA, CPA2 family (TC 2.A.37.2.1) n=1 Tax=Pilibacter termitis TaxID=263852 RepID=A0A1T4R5C5_9ENTE|nr:cation:proton antiporter [Pilibacter termitis]SKA11153.1 sodium/proton antiporter NapA, CPA2 family (TC 2.A.37.2.1) [Pilibacter termitis]
MTELGMIAIILIASMVMGSLFKRFSLPAVVGQLLVGILLGPSLLHLLKPSHTLEFLSEIGVIFLMFIAGLESDVDLLKRYMKPSVMVAILGVLLPIIVFFGAGKVFHYTNTQAIFFGIVYAATSVSITVEVLQEFKKLKSKEGATILGAAVVDDVLAVVVLSLFITVVSSSTGNAAEKPLYVTMLLQLVYIVLILAVFHYIAPFVMRISKKLPVFANTTIGAVILCLGMAELAEVCGLSDVIGAFFAGVAISNTKSKHEIEHPISVIGYAFFIPIFFASIGLKMDFTGMSKVLLILVIFTILAIATKLFGGMIASKWSGFSWGSGYMIGAGMVSRGEMALIVAQIGFDYKIIHSGIYSQLVVVIVVTTLIAPFILKHSFSYLEEVR